MSWFQIGLSVLFIAYTVVVYRCIKTGCIRHLERTNKLHQNTYKFVADVISDLVWIIGPDGRIKHVNRAWLKMTGIDPTSIKNIAEQYDIVRQHIHPEDQQKLLDIWNRCRKQGEIINVEVRFKGNLSEDWAWHAVHAECQKDDSENIVLWFGYTTNVNDDHMMVDEMRKMKEAAEATNRAKDQFLAVLSHELRTPLTPVVASLDSLLSYQHLPTEIMEEIKLINRNVQLEVGLINDLLDVTRISRGKLHVSKKVINVHDAIKKVIAICDTGLKEKEHKLELKLDAKKTHIMGDAARIKQIVWNLLLNAIKFTPDSGTITIATDNEMINESSEGIRISITDTGVGIRKEFRNFLFQPFEQAPAEPGTLPSGGLGLGLNICKMLVDLHDGKITAESEGAHCGSTFYVTFPVVAPNADEAEVKSPSIGVNNQIHDIKVLLVEDHADTRTVVGRLLTYVGYQVKAVNKTIEAINELRNGKYDIMVSDIGLPDGSGYDLMDFISQNKLNVKGIALTGYGREEDANKSITAGFHRHITKPVVLDTLNMAIQEVLSERK